MSTEQATAAVPVAAVTTVAALDPENEELIAPVEDETMDPLHPRRVSLDIFELYWYEMIMTEEVVLDKKMRKYEYGRLYNFIGMAKLVARICGRHAYHSEENNEENNDEKDVFEDRLIDFTPKQWETVAEKFDMLRESLIRKDAKLIVLPEEDYNVVWAEKVDKATFPEEDNEINAKIKPNKAFSESSFREMKDWINFHTCLSHIQPHFENAIEQEEEVIPHENIVSFYHAISELFAGDEDNGFAKILKSLFSDGKLTRDTQAEDLSLKPLKEIKKIHTNHSRVFDLKRFQSKFLSRICRWRKMMLPMPSLVKLKNGSVKANKDMPSDEFHDARSELSQLQAKQPHSEKKSNNGSKSKIQSRNEKQAHVDADDDKSSEVFSAIQEISRKKRSMDKKYEDPSPGSVSLATSLPARATAAFPKKPRHSVGRGNQKTPNLLKPKKSSRRLKFNDSDNSVEESSDDDEGNMTLSNLPEHFKHTDDRKRAACPIQIQVGGQQTSPQKRMRFTEEEDWAIKEGVKKFGSGKWSEIKSEYPMQLKNRSNVQIKDRHRILNKSSG